MKFSEMPKGVSL